MAGSVEGIVFDLDGTLCEYSRSGADVLDAAFETVGVEPFFTVDEYYARFENHVAENTNIRGIRSDTFAALAKGVDRDPAIGRAVAEAYAAERDHSAVQWLPGAERAIETLGNRYPLAVVTNGGPDMQRQKIAALGIADRFETVVHAGFDAPPKPDPTPFDIALQALGVRPGQAVTVGNSLSHDVAGAHNAGLRAVWLDREGASEPTPQPDRRIRSMHELLDEPWA
ncbi:MAG: HAD family hydrolase [Salinirussus sp.]